MLADHSDGKPVLLAREGNDVSAVGGQCTLAEFAELVRRQLELLGENTNREGLLKTPERVAESLAWLTRGYDEDLRDVVGDAVFEETHESTRDEFLRLAHRT
jgi:GTP cyclohydrolase I